MIWFVQSLCVTGQLTLWHFQYYFTVTLDDYAGLLLDRSDNFGGGVFNSNRRCCWGSSLFEDTRRTLSSATFVCIRRTSGLSRQNGLELRSAIIIMSRYQMFLQCHTLHTWKTQSFLVCDKRQTGYTNVTAY